jgi:hypothetical protein
MIVEDSCKSQKNIKKYNCNYCNYNTCNKYDYNKHLTTDKHKIAKNDSKMVENGMSVSQNIARPFRCVCGKSYVYDSGYYRHKKKCPFIENNEKNEIIEETINEKEVVDKDLVLMLLKQNAELLEIVKNGTHNTTNNINNCNNNNKSFNLQFFLNETCKDAMNIMDFVNSIQLELSDLESVGELGYIKGISNIIVKNLRALDVTKRPVHCSDAKREVLYIKDNDVWEKEDPENNKMRKAIKYISHKNTKLLPLWKEKNPDCQNYYSSKSDKYNYMVIEAMGGMGENYLEKENKIIHNIAKEVVIEK